MEGRSEGAAAGSLPSHLQPSLTFVAPSASSTRVLACPSLSSRSESMAATCCWCWLRAEAAARSRLRSREMACSVATRAVVR